MSISGNQPQTITFPALSATVFPYGTAPIPLIATSSSGLAVTYTATGSAIVTGSAAAGYALTFNGVGKGTVTASQSGNAQYSAATPAAQAFNVTPIVITVTATSASAAFGATINPAQLAYTISPQTLANGDVLTGTPALATTETPASPVGSTYPITISQGSLAVVPAGSTGFYAFNFVPGTLTVGGGTQTITFPQPPPGSAVYGQSLTLNATASSGLPVTYSVTGPAATAGSLIQFFDVGTVTVTATQAGNGSFAAAPPVTITISVAPYPLFVTTSSYTRAVGGDNPVFAYQIGDVFPGEPGGFQLNDSYNASTVQGVPTITTTATTDSPAGVYPILIDLGTLVSPKGRYTFTFPGNNTPNQVLNVTAPPAYILTANPSTLTVQTGHNQQTTIIANAVTGQAVYQGTIALSCSGLPAGVTCTFSPATITLTPNSAGTAAAPAQSALTINTNASTPVVGMLALPSVTRATVFFLPSGLMGLLLAFHRKKLRQHTGAQAVLILLVLLTGLTGLAACGGSSRSSDSTAGIGTSTITVTGTATGADGSGSPNVVDTINLTLNITK